jgi:hypothetical protein
MLPASGVRIAERSVIDVVLFGLSLLCLSTGGRAQQVAVLPPPWRQIVISAPFESGQLSMPKISGERLIFFPHTVRSGDGSQIRLMSLDGQQTQTIPFPFDCPLFVGALSIRVADLALTASQHIIVSGVVTKDSANTSVNFVLDADSSGHTVRYLDLADYTAERVCTSSSEGVWTLGEVWSKEATHDTAYSLLHEYEWNGGAMPVSLLPRSANSVGSQLDLDAGDRESSPAYLSRNSLPYRAICAWHQARRGTSAASPRRFCTLLRATEPSKDTLHLTASRAHLRLKATSAAETLTQG